MAMAAVLEAGAAAMMMACSSSSSSRPVMQGQAQGHGAMCSSSQVSAVSPLRLMSNGTTSSSRAVLPTSRGLKLSSGAFSRTRLPAAVRVYSQQRKGIVCEASETAVGATGVVDDRTFDSLVMNCDVLVLVDFWAPWCGPCRMIAPIIDELAKEYAGKLRCLKLNTDESPRIATEYGIRSIPTVMIFKTGQKMDTVIGAVPRATLRSTIEKYLD